MKANRIKEITIELRRGDGLPSRRGEYHSSWSGIEPDESPEMSEEDAIVSLIAVGKSILKTAFENMLDESLERTFELVMHGKKEDNK